MAVNCAGKSGAFAGRAQELPEVFQEVHKPHAKERNLQLFSD